MVLIKKRRSTGQTSRYAEYHAEKINSKKNYMISTRLNVKTRFVQKKKRHAIIN